MGTTERTWQVVEVSGHRGFIDYETKEIGIPKKSGFAGKCCDKLLLFHEIGHLWIWRIGLILHLEWDLIHVAFAPWTIKQKVNVARWYTGRVVKRW